MAWDTTKVDNDVVEPADWNAMVEYIKGVSSATQNITAASDTILANAKSITLNPDADYTMTSTPTIADATNTGEYLFIGCDNAETFTVTLQDQDTLANSNLQLRAPLRSITGKQAILLRFDGTNWVEIGPNVVPGTGAKFNVVDYSADATGSADSSSAFIAAIAAAGVLGGVVLVPPGTYKISANVTVPADVTIDFHDGAQISVDTTKTFTFSDRSGLKAGIYHIFAGAGTVTLGVGCCTEIYPQWFGAVGDDSTDCAAAFNAALVASAKVGTVFVPAGTYQVTTPIYKWPTTTGFSTQRAGVVMRGAGNGDTIIKYTGSTGYAIEVRPASQYDTSIVCGHTIENLHIQASSVTSVDVGGAILCNGSNHTLNGINVTYCDDGTAFAFIGRDVSIEETGMTHDTDRDFTTTGAGASEKYAFKFTTGAVANLVHSITATMGKTGNPAGTGWWEIWTDVAGLPGAQTGSDSESITLDNLSADAAGAEVEILFGETLSTPSVSASTDYWAVFCTNGYTYADGVTEVRLRVDAGGGAADTFATYNFGVAWTSSADGLNNNVEIRMGQGINHRMNDCFTYGPVDKVGRGIRLEDSAILMMNGCFIAAQIGLYSKRCDSLLCSGTYWYIDDQLMEAHGVGWINFGSGSWLEGGATDSEVTGKVSVSFTGAVIGGGYYGIAGETMWTNGGTKREPNLATYRPDVLSEYWKYRVVTSLSKKWDVTGTAISPVADADALMGYCHQLDAQNEAVSLAIYPDGSNTGMFHYGQLPAGTYKITIWAKDSNQVASDMRVQIRHRNGAWSNDTLTAYTVTADYLPYYAFIVVDEAQFAASRHGNQVYIYKAGAGANTISISHLVVEHIGPDELLRSEPMAYNSLGGDADGDRLSRMMWWGRRSGDEISMLAAITASHDGAADDRKGKLAIGTNDGNTNDAPIDAITIDSAQEVTLAGPVHLAGLKSGATQVAAGAAAGEMWHDTDDDTLKIGV